MVGSPRFMSPEALRGEVVDHRGDIYSLGVVLYMVLVGRNYVFDWATRPVFAPPSQFGAEAFPVGLDAAILKAVEPHAEERFQSAEELLDALRPLRPVTTVSRSWLPRVNFTSPSRKEDE